MELNILCFNVYIFLGSCTEARFKKTPKIINGVPISIERFPFMVKFLNTKIGGNCTANIISESYALTAAHCTLGIHSPDDILLEVGTSYWYVQGVKHTVRRVFGHREHNFPLPNNDIAVLEVNERFQFNRRVQPIAMYPHLDVPDGSKVTVVGWGRTEPYVEGMTKVLMKVETEVWPLDECKKFWKELPFKFEIVIEITDKMICTGCRNKTGGSCMGDSGGPLIYKGRLIGIVSGGYSHCGKKNIPSSIFTRVAAYKCWIDSIAFNQSKYY